MTQQHGMSLDQNAPEPESSAERITEPATPQAPPLALLTNVFSANAPSGPQIAVQVGIGDPETTEQKMANVVFVPEDQAVTWAQNVLTQVTAQVEASRRARLGVPGLLLPGAVPR